jgi:hypothetical protein
MGGLSRNFLCLGCKHIYEYSPRDVVDLPPDEQRTLSGKKRRSVVCVELRCDVEGCESQVKIHMLAASELEAGKGVSGYLARATVQTIRCDKGHMTTTVPKILLHSWFDDDWERPEM